MIRTFYLGVWGTSTSFGSVVVANHVAGWLQAIALLVGITSGIIAIYWMDKLNSAKFRQINASLCEACRRGTVPRQCPLAARERPQNCPLDNRVRESITETTTETDTTD